MGSESGSGSHDERDDDDDEEYEEAGGGNRFLGFMFGNVDNSGDLDVDYLDEDAKEHLAALADKLGHSLTEMDLSVKSPQTPADTAEQDYDEKAEDAVDCEDIDEQYEGPETQAVTEEDYLLPKKEYFSTEASQSALGATSSVFDDENYDEDEEPETEHQAEDTKVEARALSLSGDQAVCHAEQENFTEDDQQLDSLDTEDLEEAFEEFQEGWKLPDMMFATRRSLSDACNTASRQLENVYTSIAATKQKLSSRIDKVDSSLDNVATLTAATKEQVSELRGKAEIMGLDVNSVRHEVKSLDATNSGVIKLCDFASNIDMAATNNRAQMYCLKVSHSNLFLAIA